MRGDKLKLSGWGISPFYTLCRYPDLSVHMYYTCKNTCLLCCLTLAVVAKSLSPPLFSSYLSEGFLQLESVMDRAIIEWKTGNAVEMDVELRGE